MFSEHKFIINGIEQGLRADGRGTLTSRRINVTRHTISFACGSCTLSLDISSPFIIGGCKAELTDKGGVEFGVEFVQRSSQLVRENERKIKEMVQELCLDYFDQDQLILVPGEKMWKIYLDVIVLDSEASNLIEHLTLATLISLQSIVLPNISAIKNKNTGEISIQIEPGSWNLDVSHLPVIISVSQISGKLVLDLTKEEEACSEGRFQVSVNRAGEICSIVKDDKGIMSFENLYYGIYLVKGAALQIFERLNGETIRYNLT